MKCIKKIALLQCLTAICWEAQSGAAANSSRIPMKEKLYIYVLMGQSNMAGRGEIGGEDKTAHARVLMFTSSNQWEAAIEPLTHDKPGMLGVGPGLAFGKAMAEKYPDAAIGLVPCAVGGTPLRRWQRGADLYSNAVQHAQLAMRDGTLKGVLWHQGESDAGTATNANSYGERLAQMIQDLRTDLNSPSLPFVAGQIGEFLYTRKQSKLSYPKVINETLAALPQKVPATGCALSNGLKDKGDELHFDAASQHELGRRYAAEMIKLIK
jgi:hypothetical protein